MRELAAKKVDIVKIWVDDRNKTVTPLPPSLYRPIIEEAHARGLRVVAHVYYLADAKELLRAGIDGFAHGIRDLEVDDEIMGLFKQRPQVFVIPNLPDTPPSMADLDMAQRDAAGARDRGAEEDGGCRRRRGHGCSRCRPAVWRSCRPRACASPSAPMPASARPTASPRTPSWPTWSRPA